MNPYNRAGKEEGGSEEENAEAGERWCEKEEDDGGERLYRNRRRMKNGNDDKDDDDDDYAQGGRGGGGGRRGIVPLGRRSSRGNRGQLPQRRRWGIIMLLLLITTCHTSWSNNYVMASSSSSSYGVDVTFPIHHTIHTSSEANNPFGDERYNFYQNYMEDCSHHASSSSNNNGDEGDGNGKEECYKAERNRMKNNLEQPPSMKNFTELGYYKTRAPTQMYQLMYDFFHNNSANEKLEGWSTGETVVNHWDVETTMVNFEDDTLVGATQELRDELWLLGEDIIKDWTGQTNLKPSALYGVRVYKEGAVLAPHVDDIPRISSAIINIDQDVDEDWILEVIGHDGLAHNITLAPGDMALYESHSVVHGRPFPLKGRFYANVFIHFEPVDEEEDSNSPDGGSSKRNSDQLPFYIVEGTSVAEEWREKRRRKRAEMAREAVFDEDMDALLDVAEEDPTLLFVPDENGWNTLHEASRLGDVEMVKFLLSHPEADVNARTHEDVPHSTPFGWAMEEHGEDHPILDLLLDHGAIPVDGEF